MTTPPRALLAVLLLVVPSNIPTPTPGKPAHDNQRESSPNHSVTKRNDADAAQSPAAIHQSAPLVTTRNQKQPGAPNDREAASDWWSRANTIALTLFTGALALLAFFQWRAMHKQANTMRD